MTPAGKPAAKQGDLVVGLDTHVLMMPSPGGPVPTPTPMPFSGKLSSELCDDVRAENKAVAVEGSVAVNNPPHIPAGGPFQRPPANEARVQVGSRSVLVHNKPLARLGDQAFTCGDPVDGLNGRVVSTSTVLVGD